MHWLGKATYCNWHYKSIVLADTFLNSNIKRIVGVDGNILHLLFDSVNDFRKNMNITMHVWKYVYISIIGFSLLENEYFFECAHCKYYSDVHMSYSEPLCFSHFLCTIINLSVQLLASPNLFSPPFQLSIPEYWNIRIMSFSDATLS